MSDIATDAAAYERRTGRWSHRLAEVFLGGIALPHAAGLRQVKEAGLTILQDFNDLEEWSAAWLTRQGIVGACRLALSQPDRARLPSAPCAAWGAGPGCSAPSARRAICMAA